MRPAFFAAALTAIICSECFAEFRIFRRRTLQDRSSQQQRVVRQETTQQPEVPRIEFPRTEVPRAEAGTEKRTAPDGEIKAVKKPAPRLRD